MASMTLGFVGNMVGGPIGGFIGSAIGGLIDNALFPTKVEGPRLSDLSVTTSAYGETIPIIYGPSNRLAGKLIWSSGLIETQRKVKQGGKGGPSVQATEYSYRTSCAFLICDGETDSIRRILCNGKTVYDVDAGITDWGLFGAVRIYTGSASQNPDPVIEAYEGAGNAPAYRRLTYVVFEDLQLADFGNRIPSVEVFCRAQASISVAEIVGNICERCGLDPDTVGRFTLSGMNCDGYRVGNAASGLGAIQPLALVYDFDMVEDFGSLEFVSRRQRPQSLIMLDDLAGHQGNADRPEAIRWSRRRATELPRESAVVYADTARDMQAGTQRARRSEGSVENNLKVEAPLSLTADVAQAVADRLLWEAWNSATEAKFSSDDRLLILAPGRLYALSTPSGEVEAVRLRRKTRGANGVIDFEVSRDNTAVYELTADGVPSSVPPNLPALPGETDFLFLDMPIVRATDDDTGFYWTVNAERAGWRGADVLRSSDGGNSFDNMASTNAAATTGLVTSAAGSGSVVTWDRGSSLEVDLEHADMSLESVDELEVLNGANAAWIGPASGQGGEIIQFADAVQLSSVRWRLSTLLRGRLGTDHATGSMANGMRFILLDAEILSRNDYGLSDLDVVREYKAVSLLTSEADATAVQRANSMEGKRPLSPVLGYGVRDGSGDVTVHWQRRSRFPQAGFGVAPLPLFEDAELYAVEFLDGATVVRTVETSDRQVTYTAAEQTADGLTPGDPVDCRVYQISGLVGRGRPASFTV